MLVTSHSQNIRVEPVAQIMRACVPAFVIVGSLQTAPGSNVPMNQRQEQVILCMTFQTILGPELYIHDARTYMFSTCGGG
jgi:hypothetical protein